MKIDKERQTTMLLKDAAWWARFRLIVLALLPIIGLSVWLIFDTGEQDASKPVLEMRVLSVKESYPLALEIARKWRSDAVLADADTWFRPVGQEGKLSVAYSFRSPGEPQVWLLVYVYEDPGGGERIEQEEGIFETDRPVGEPIDPLQLPFDSAEALEIIMSYGGEAFLREYEHPVWPLSLHLERRLPDGQGEIIWWGGFWEGRTLESKDIEIDANTGQSVE